MALNPSEWMALNIYAGTLIWVGRPEEAIPLYQKAIRLNPYGPSSLYRMFGLAFRNTGRYEEAVSACKTAIQILPDDLIAHIILASTYSMMGRDKEAHAEASEVLRINPNFSVDNYVKRVPYKDQSQNDKLANALRKAGLK